MQNQLEQFQGIVNLVGEKITEKATKDSEMLVEQAIGILKKNKIKIDGDILRVVIELIISQQVQGADLWKNIVDMLMAETGKAQSNKSGLNITN